MKAVIQRVKKASVSVEGEVISSIGKGFLILLGIQVGDTEEDIDYLSRKIAFLRIFERDGKFNDSLMDIGGEALVVSQFTLLGRTERGNRPDFLLAEKPPRAEELFNMFCEKLSEYVPVKRGIFGARMDVSLINNGPVTIIIGSRREK